MGESNTTGVEVELKLRVDDLAALMRVATASGGVPAPTAIQHNHYLDTTSRDLQRLGVVLRLRHEEQSSVHHYYLTAKRSGQKKSSGPVQPKMLSSVQEEECTLDEPEALTVFSGGDAMPFFLRGQDPMRPEREALVTAMRESVGDRTLTVIGTLRNERTRIQAWLRPTREGAQRFLGVLELDRVMFPGNQIHHEVELEVPTGVDPDDAYTALLALFEQAGVEGRASYGKARRFFAALRGEELK